MSKFTAKRYQFRYIEPVKDLSKVFIYGDSISIGYTEYARASLEDLACVYRLHVNGGSSNDFIAKMERRFLPWRPINTISTPSLNI